MRRWVWTATAVVTVGCGAGTPVAQKKYELTSGVNIIPKAVLAAEKVTPSTKPVDSSATGIIDVLSAQDQHGYHFIELLRNANLVPLIQTEGPYTVFAPTDAAFDKLPPGRLEWLLKSENHPRLVTFVKYHLLSGRLSQVELLHTIGEVKTMAGSSVVVRGVDGRVIVNDANLTRTDDRPVNGTVHWLDSILDPDFVR